MRRFHWTWEEFCATPMYVISKCIDILEEEQDDLSEAADV